MVSRAQLRRMGPATLRLRIRPRPLPRCCDGSVLVLLPPLRYIVGERVVWVRRAEECLDGEEDGADLEGGGPVAYTLSIQRLMVLAR